MTEKPRLEILDGLRGVAAVVVLLSHVGEMFRWPFIVNHAHLAVDFFFMLSGYVIGYAYDARWTEMGVLTFFRRRVERLHPLVVSGTALGLVLAAVELGLFGRSLPDIGAWGVGGTALAVACALLVIPFGTKGGMNPFNDISWSLAYEYVASFLYATVFRRLGRRTLSVAVALAAVASVLVALRIELFGLLLKHGYTFSGGWRFTPQHVYVGMTRLLFPFLTGLLLVRLGWKIRTARAFWTCLVVVAVVLFIPKIGEGLTHASSVWNGVYELACLFVVFPLVILVGAGGSLANGTTSRVCLTLGALSYPIYMMHYPVVRLAYVGWVLGGRYDRAPFAVNVGVAAVTVIVAIFVAWLALKCYDEPVRRILRKR